MAGDLATIADFRAFLNFDERPDPCVVADFAAVEIYECVNLHVATKLYIGRNALVVRKLYRSQRDTGSAGASSLYSLALEGRKRLVRAGEGYRGAMILKGCGCGLKDLHQLEPLPPPGQAASCPSQCSR